MRAEEEAREALAYHPSKVSWATAKFVGAPPSAAARLFFYAVVATLFLALGYAYFARVAVVIEAPGIITPEAGILPISAPVTFTVKHLLVANGQSVAKDQLLVVSEDALTDEEAERILAERKQLLELLDADAKGGCARCGAELEALAQKAFVVDTSGAIRERLAGLRLQLRELSSARALYDGRGSSTAGLRRSIAVARGKLEEIEKRKATELLSTKVEQLNSEIVAAESQLAEREKGDRAVLDQARIRLSTALGELAADVDRYRSQQAISAPIAGTVIELGVTGPGQRVAAGQVVMQLVAEGAVLAVQLRVANKDISRVKPGMEVRLELAALPVREYGAVTGKVLSVAPNAKLEAVGPAAAKAGPQPIYEVLVKLDAQEVKQNGKVYPFRMGMALRGLVVSSYESMLTLAVKRLLSLKDELVKEY